MAGHTPTRLKLTRSALPGHGAAGALRDVLRREYSVRLRRSPTPAAGQSQDWGSIVLGGRDTSFEIDYLADPTGSDMVCPSVLLHSEAYEGAVDLLRRKVQPRGKEALLDLCVALAAAAEAEAFSLDFARDDDADPLATAALVAGLVSSGPGSLLHGIAVDSPLSPKVRATWPSSRVLNGYLVVDFIGA
jgi:hypothetical protein